MATYWEKLRDPRWQQMRLRVMAREKFACQECGDTTTTLNVHHTYYERKKDPWDYYEGSLKCLCEPCHEAAEYERLVLLRMMSDMRLDLQRQIRGFVQGMILEQNPEARYSYESDYVALGMIAYHDVEFDSRYGYMAQLLCDVNYSKGRGEEVGIDLERLLAAIKLKREFDEMDVAEAAREASEAELLVDTWGLAANA